jgi:putative endonuclease
VTRPSDVGRAGEDAAARVYLDHGYRLVARNWRCRIGELDLIVRRGDTLVVCEVKARRGARFGGGYEAVDGRKQQKLRAVAEVYLQRSAITTEQVRFDVARVVVGPTGSARVELFEDAF